MIRISTCNEFTVVLSSGPPIDPSTKFTYDGQEYTLNVSTLRHLGLLGQGAHGTVLKMQHTQSAAVMAVKVKLLRLVLQGLHRNSERG